MAGWALLVVSSLGSVVLAGKATEEDLAHYTLKDPTTLVPWTSNERRINKMIVEEIEKYNYAPETTECPLDSEGRPKPTEGKQPTWWNAYRQAKDGDRPDWKAEIKDLLKNPRTYPPWTPSQESEAVQSRWKNIEPFTWRPGAPIINLRIKTDATTRPSEPQEPTTERSIYLSSAHWESSSEVAGGGGGEGKEPPLNLAPLKKGYKEDDEYLKVKPRRKQRKIIAKQKFRIHLHQNKGFVNKVSLVNHKQEAQKPDMKMKKDKEEDRLQKEMQMKRGRRQRPQNNMLNFARI